MENQYKKHTLTYRFLDDETIEEKERKKERKRLRNIQTNKEYAEKNKEKLREYRKKLNDRNRIERAKGDRKKWQELKDEDDIITQVDKRTYQNLNNNTIGKIYNDSNGWYYIITYLDGREYYKSEYFSTKIKAVQDLRLAI